MSLIQWSLELSTSWGWAVEPLVYKGQVEPLYKGHVEPLYKGHVEPLYKGQVEPLYNNYIVDILYKGVTLIIRTWGWVF